MMEDKINELEKLKRINKKRKIVLTILICFLVFLGIYIVSIYVSSNSCSYDGTNSIQRNEIDAFNSRFVSQIGNAKLGAIAKSLCSTVMTSNSQWTDDESRIVYIKFGDITGLDTREKWKNSDATCDTSELVTIRNKINSSRRYDITASYDKKGRIMGIGVTEK